MTKEFEKLIDLLRHSVFGMRNECEENCDLELVCEVALKQGVFPLVYGALTKEQKSSLSPKWEQLFFRAMMKNEQKMVSLSGIIKKLEEAKIPYCILKGCTVAADYHLSECRLSGDIDLYVKPEFEKKASQLFKSLGFDVEVRPKGKQDFKVSSPASGLIEVHVQLYNEDFSRVVLRDKFGVTEDFSEVTVNEFLAVKSLGPNDTLDFLTTHFIKHFVREGSGIRQITDLLAFVNRHKEEIDFPKYFERLDEINFRKLILNVFGIGVKYFGLELAEYSMEMVDEIMDDVEAGENFGFGEAERNGFYERFLKEFASQKPGDGNTLVKNKHRAIIKSVFLPSRKQLINKGYSYLKKTSIFYPVAYVHRLWDVAVSVVLRKRNIKSDLGYAQKTNSVIDSRMKMMKKLDIVQ